MVGSGPPARDVGFFSSIIGERLSGDVWLCGALGGGLLAWWVGSAGVGVWTWRCAWRSRSVHFWCVGPFAHGVGALPTYLSISSRNPTALSFDLLRLDPISGTVESPYTAKIHRNLETPQAESMNPPLALPTASRNRSTPPPPSASAPPRPRCPHSSPASARSAPRSRSRARSWVPSPARPGRCRGP